MSEYDVHWQLTSHDLLCILNGGASKVLYGSHLSFAHSGWPLGPDSFNSGKVVAQHGQALPIAFVACQDAVCDFGWAVWQIVQSWGYDCTALTEMCLQHLKWQQFLRGKGAWAC